MKTNMKRDGSSSTGSYVERGGAMTGSAMFPAYPPFVGDYWSWSQDFLQFKPTSLGLILLPLTFIFYVFVNVILVAAGLVLTSVLSVAWLLSVLWWIVVSIPKWLVTETFTIEPGASCDEPGEIWPLYLGLIALLLIYAATFFSFKVQINQFLREPASRGRWRITYLARSCQFALAMALPLLCLALCRVSRRLGLPLCVHCIYLACQGLAVPSQVIPRDATAEDAAARILEWKLPCLGCARSGSAKFYHFSLQLFWCASQYLDCVNAALAVRLEYPYANSMALVLLLSLAFQVFAAKDWKKVVFGIAPSAVPADEVNRLILVRLLSENIPQIRFQVSLALWAQDASAVVPFITVAISSFYVLRELAPVIISLSQADSSYLPATEELVESPKGEKEDNSEVRVNVKYGPEE